MGWESTIYLIKYAHSITVLYFVWLYNALVIAKLMISLWNWTGATRYLSRRLDNLNLYLMGSGFRVNTSNLLVNQGTDSLHLLDLHISGLTVMIHVLATHHNNSIADMTNISECATGLFSGAWVHWKPWSIFSEQVFYQEKLDSLEHFIYLYTLI